jgi:hypothetical protein
MSPDHKEESAEQQLTNPTNGSAGITERFSGARHGWLHDATANRHAIASNVVDAGGPEKSRQGDSDAAMGRHARIVAPGARHHSNVYFDLSLTIPHISRPAVALAEALELAPVSKLLYASDAARAPELYFLAASWWCDALEEVLPQLLAGEAAHSAARIMRENARRVPAGVGPHVASWAARRRSAPSRTLSRPARPGRLERRPRTPGGPRARRYRAPAHGLQRARRRRRHLPRERAAS